MSRFGACSARISGDRQTHTHTDRQTDTQTKYSNPRCACVPRVNNADDFLKKCQTLYACGYGADIMFMIWCQYEEIPSGISGVKMNKYQVIQVVMVLKCAEIDAC